MKNSFLYIAIFFCYAVLYSAEPLVKFYLNDGNSKQYNLSEIDSLGVIDKKNNYVMRIHYDDTLIAYYPTEIIGSIKFENDSLNVYIFSYPKPYLLSAIDSLIFYIDQYQPLTIGSQVWMLKNLNVDHYRNGDSIPHITDPSKWAQELGTWCYYNNDPSIGVINGKLYNWYAVNDPRGLAPVGWDVPTDSEWKVLVIYLGMSKTEADSLGERGNDEGGKMKEIGEEHWKNPNIGATNTSGFSALPSGICDNYQSATFLGYYGFWWTSTDYHTDFAWRRVLGNYSTKVFRTGQGKFNGLSVRCIKNK